jgi:hypothetical protein
MRDGRSRDLMLIDSLHDRDLPFPVAPEPEQNDPPLHLNEFHGAMTRSVMTTITGI